MTDGDRQQLNTYICDVAAGVADALDGIYAIAAKRMYVAALTVVGDRAAAEDVVSDSFIKIARFAKKYKRDGQPMAWILRIVRNTALDYLRKRRRRAEVSAEEILTLTDDGYSPERRESAIILEQALSSLNPDERRVIYMRYYLDMSVREIGGAVKISRSSAQRLIERAEEKLKNLLKGDTN